MKDIKWFFKNYWRTVRKGKPNLRLFNQLIMIIIINLFTLLLLKTRL